MGRGPPHLVHDSLLCTLRAKILCTPGSAAWAYVPLGLLHGPTCPWVCCMGLRALGSAAWAYVLLGLLRGSMCSWVCCVPSLNLPHTYCTRVHTTACCMRLP